MRFLPLLIVLLAAMTASPARAQLPPTLSEEAQISLLTILPGDALYSAFGHSAFRVMDPTQRLDVSFNYGTFAFDDPLFVPKFIYGQLDYLLSVGSTGRAVRYYRDVEGRPTVEQRLALTPAQREAVYRFLVVNARPENRAYRYDFLFDNCATRLRDVLTSTLPDSVRFLPEPDPAASFRHLLDPYVADQPFLDLGYDLLLGQPTDRRATPSEAAFLPDVLMASFAHAEVLHPDGAWRPLVATTDTIAAVPNFTRPAASWPWPATLLWALFALGAVATVRAWRQPKRARRRWPDVVLLAVVGLLGALMLFMWTITLHEVTSQNWNLLWAWPTHLVAAVAVARGGSASWLRPYFLASATVCGVTLLGWSFWPQDLHDALIPLVLLIGLRSAWLATRARRTSAAATPLSAQPS